MSNPGFHPFALLLATAACADAGDRPSPEEGSPAPEPIVRDSAGIRIVESSAPAWDGDGWHLSDTPEVVIGRREGDERYLFGSIGGGLVLADGRIAVLDRLAEVIERVLSAPYPPHLPSFEWLHVDPGGNIWAGQRRYGAGSDMDESFVFAKDGRYLGVVEVPAKLSVLQIGSDFILAQFSDDLDAQYVHLHRIGK